MAGLTAAGGLSLLFLILLSGFTLFLGWGVLASTRMLRPIRMRVEVTPAFLGLPWEAVSLRTRDRVSLSGWFVSDPSPQGGLLLLHGFGTCKADVLDVARALREKGRYHLLLIDLRGHGDSGGDVSFGLREVLDVQAGLELLSRRLGSKPLPLGCYGLSMGGSVALLAAAQLPEIRAVVTDSAYGDFSRVVARRQWLSYHIPRWLSRAPIWIALLRLGCSSAQVSPVRAIRRIAPRRLLLIHGAGDVGIPPVEARALREAAGGDQELWLVDGAEHAACFYRKKEEYASRVVRFLQGAFRGEA